MEKEENVYVENAETEQVAVATGREDGREDCAQKGSAVLGKFKDVDALAKAYGALQAEFTRRSQRLKELERQAENVALKSETGNGKSASGVEKLKNGARERKEEREAFQRFVAELENREGAPAKAEAEEGILTAQEEVATPQKTETFETGTAKTEVPSKEQSVACVANSREGTFDGEEELYKRVRDNESVRLKIIGEYLSSLQKTGAPLMKGGVGAFAAPPLKAKTIDEAGSMALRLFKEGRKLQS